MRNLLSIDNPFYRQLVERYNLENGLISIARFSRDMLGYSLIVMLINGAVIAILGVDSTASKIFLGVLYLVIRIAPFGVALYATWMVHTANVARKSFNEQQVVWGYFAMISRRAKYAFALIPYLASLYYLFLIYWLRNCSCQDENFNQVLGYWVLFSLMIMLGYWGVYWASAMIGIASGIALQSKSKSLEITGIVEVIFLALWGTVLAISFGRNPEGDFVYSEQVLDYYKGELSSIGVWMGLVVLPYAVWGIATWMAYRAVERESNPVITSEG